jgi:uncharacterized protein (DUF2132 family)
MTHLFCTPVQGVKLKKLLPKLTSEFVWIELDYDVGIQLRQRRHGNAMSVQYVGIGESIVSVQHNYINPALTLQELRDVAIEHGMDISDLEDHLYSSTAPKLADWVIERLEEAK